MRKTIFAILAAASLVACSNDEFVNVADKEAIAFDNAFVDNSTRSVVDPSFTNSNLFADAVGKVVNQTNDVVEIVTEY